MNYLSELTGIIKINGKFIDHDPVNPIIPFDYDKKVYKSPDRNIMSFIKPILIHYYQYNNVYDRYVLEYSTETSSYHRPIEFYDHVLSPDEIDNLSQNNVIKYIIYFIKNNRLFESDVLFFMINSRVPFMVALQEKIIEKRYRIIKDYSASNYINRELKFDETWNTSFYYHLLPPRRKIYFLNIKYDKCTCSSFKKKYTCSHLYNVMMFRCFNNYFNSVVLASDITKYYLYRCYKEEQ